MWPRIKTFLWVHREDFLIVCVVLLALLAAFQMGRLSVIYGAPSAFTIYDRT